MQTASHHRRSATHKGTFPPSRHRLPQRVQLNVAMGTNASLQRPRRGPPRINVQTHKHIPSHSRRTGSSNKTQYRSRPGQCTLSNALPHLHHRGLTPAQSHRPSQRHSHGLPQIDPFNHLAYTDDFSIFAQTDAKMQHLMDTIARFQNWNGIRVNMKKTSIMAVDGDERRRKTLIHVSRLSVAGKLALLGNIVRYTRN